MTDQFQLDDETTILIELRHGRGVVDVSSTRESDLAEKSAKAFAQAMSTIQTVAKQTANTIRSLEILDQPDVIEMAFGLKLTSEANALVVNAGVEAQIEVKLIWNNDKKSKQ